MILVRAPLRVSFFGGGSDFPGHFRAHGGVVLSTTIQQAVYVLVQRRWDDLICAHYTERELVDSPEQVRHDLIREALRLTGVRAGVEVTTLADVPSQGCGLGSSSSITVALLHALHACQGELPTAARLAEEACHVELGLLRRPNGCQDQWIAALGGFRLIRFSAEGVDAQRLAVPDATLRRLEVRLSLWYTGLTRQAADILAGQQACLAQSAGLLSEMAEMAVRGAGLLQVGNLDGFGALLDVAWEAKRALNHGTTNETIDRMYSAAKAAGALGGKICGAGGGGFLLLYTPPESQDGVRCALQGYRELPVRFDRLGSRVVLDYRCA